MGDPDTTDIAIVGGGISGLYSAWRLGSFAKSRVDSIVVFEATNRLGGRIDTTPIPGASCSVEMGAMRFTKCMTLVRNLLAFFDIKTEAFPCQSLKRVYLRGTQVHFDESGSATNLPYHLATDEPSNPVLLAKKLLENAIPNSFSLTERQWERAIRETQFNGIPLWRWGFWNLIEELASNEAYSYLHEGFGLRSVMTNVNAAMSIRLMSLPLQDALRKEVFRPRLGWDSLVRALEEKTTALPLCRIEVSHKVVALSRSSKGIDLVVEEPDGGSRTIHARRVVLALPRRALESISVVGLLPVAQFHQLLSNVTAIPVFRICCAYDSPWWPEDICDSCSVTDLPLRQAFFGLGVGGDLKQNSNVLLASYADMDATSFWSGLADISSHVLVDERKAPEDSGAIYDRARHSRLVDAVNRELPILLNISNQPPNPNWTGYIDWSRPPFGGAWHEWLPGVDVMAEIPHMRNPFPEVPVFICGEAYSYFQGWIEGALVSAERMLQDHFGLQWPGWLDKSFFLGP